MGLLLWNYELPAYEDAYAACCASSYKVRLYRASVDTRGIGHSAYAVGYFALIGQHQQSSFVFEYLYDLWAHHADLPPVIGVEIYLSEQLALDQPEDQFLLVSPAGYLDGVSAFGSAEGDNPLSIPGEGHSGDDVAVASGDDGLGCHLVGVPDVDYGGFGTLLAAGHQLPIWVDGQAGHPSSVEIIHFLFVLFAVSKKAESVRRI